MSNNNFLEIACDIAERYIGLYSPESHKWDWGEAVLMFGLIELYKITKKNSFLEFVRKWMDFHLKNGYKMREINSCAPAISAMELYKILNETKYLEPVKTALHYLKHDAVRSTDGGICHFGYSGYKFASLWVDSLFMFGIFLVRWSELTGEKYGIDEFGSQLKIFSEKLENSGFFLHTSGWINVNQEPNIFWARGNSWVTVALAEYVRIRKLRNEEDEYAEKLLGRHVNMVLSMQDKDTSLWWTLLNRPSETYLETSASALFAYGLAILYNNNLINSPIKKSILKTAKAILSNLDRDEFDHPIVKGTSMGTIPGNFEHYAKIKTKSDVTYGVGSVLLLLSEVSKIPP